MPLRGDRLRSSREKAGLSQRDLGVRCGLGVNQIYLYENGKSDPSSDSLARIARELNVSMDYLSGLSDFPNGQLSESSLTADERRLIEAFDSGDMAAIFDLFAQKLRKHRDRKRGVSSVEPPVDQSPVDDSK